MSDFTADDIASTRSTSDLEEAEARLDVATGISTVGSITDGLRAALKIEEVCHA